MSPVDEVNDRLRAALAALTEVKGDGSACPTAETIWKSASEQLGIGRKNEDVILHQTECSACAAAWRVARELVQAEAAAQTGLVTFPWRRWVPLAVAASIIMVAIGVGIWVVPDRDAVTPVYRTQQSDWLRPEMPEGVALDKEQCDLRWTSGPEGTTYDLLVNTEDLEPLARVHRLEQAEYRVAHDALRDLPPGASIFWRVTAHLPEGRSVTSRTFTTTLE
jgi:hypothetical protein